MQISEQHKDIIGTYDESGNPKKWPKVNFTGGRYNKPATTQQISPEYFVVLPAGFKDWEAVKVLKEQYAAPVMPTPVPVVRAAKKGDE